MWQSYLPEVMAVVDAIHEPSLAMTHVGAEIIANVSTDETHSGRQSDAANVWRFMADAMRESAR